MSTKLVILLHYHIPMFARGVFGLMVKNGFLKHFLGCYLPLLTVFREIAKLG